MNKSVSKDKKQPKLLRINPYDAKAIVSSMSNKDM